jgi:hypothetical protein
VTRVQPRATRGGRDHRGGRQSTITMRWTSTSSRSIPRPVRAFHRGRPCARGTHLGREGQERGRPDAGPAPGGRDSGVALPPSAALAVVQRLLRNLGAGCREDGAQGGCQKLAVIPAGVVQAVVDPVHAQVCGLVAENTAPRASPMPFIQNLAPSAYSFHGPRMSRVSSGRLLSAR